MKRDIFCGINRYSKKFEIGVAANNDNSFNNSFKGIIDDYFKGFGFIIFNIDMVEAKARVEWILRREVEKND